MAKRPTLEGMSRSIGVTGTRKLKFEGRMRKARIADRGAHPRITEQELGRFNRSGRTTADVKRAERRQMTSRSQTSKRK